MSVYMAMDQGTTSSRALVFDGAGAVLAQAQHEFAQHFPEPGWVEHDAEEILESQWRAALEAHAAAGAPTVDAVGITNQRETVVVFERASGKPIHRAIVWQDRRTTEVLGGLRDRAEWITGRTGLPLDPYFSAAKIAWILDRVPGARAAAERGELCAGTIDTWLQFRLSRGDAFVTEPSNASRTSLYDLRSGDWCDELLETFRVPRACLPEIRPSAGELSRIAETGWPITGVLGDQQAALFGQGCTEPGSAKCTYGTGAFLLTNCGTVVPEPKDGVLGTVAWRIGDEDTFALEGAVLVSGALVQWLRDGLEIIENSAEVEALARSVPDTGGVVIVPAFTGLGTPHWDPDARGTVLGLTRGTTRAHLVRAALEGIACQVGEILTAMQKSTGRPMTELRVDGGAVANDLLLEMQAALSGVSVRRPSNLETTAVGAMRMARVGVGDALAAGVDEGTTFAPTQAVLDADQTWRRWAHAVDRSRGWAAIR